MKFIKKYLKIIIGVGVLIFVVMVFVGAQQSTNLESGTLKDWRAASQEQRAAAAQIITAGTENNELLVACVDKMAALPDSAETTIQTALTLCYTGIQLRSNI